ncbi:hypothetical protein CERSUDRAFT_72555 [Gelatoporia subvermispora B]|uniref:DUF6534 domain-containing protein n=1 Tax=Ceriporiopsis subvermispora (strain B) TaxID=914234 RepID=M2PRZ9_CERS8|nr:hypothetical protein CERSUDRAFT_72555 [Gelatoporia subvermispora B]
MHCFIWMAHWVPLSLLQWSHLPSLFGMTTIQPYIYLHHSDGDSRVFKAILTQLLIDSEDRLSLAFICHLAYTYAVTEFCNPLGLLREIWSVFATVYVTAVMDFCVRSIFCIRIWKFSNKNWFVTTPIMICTFGELGYSHTAQAEYYVAFMSSIVANTLVVICQIIFLWKRRSKVPATQSMIRTMMIYSINTGLWATVSQNFAYIAIFMALPTLLFNALLATLNARQELREIAREKGEMIAIPLSTMPPTGSTMTADVRDIRSDRTLSSIPICITKKVEVEREGSIV